MPSPTFLLSALTIASFCGLSSLAFSLAQPAAATAISNGSTAAAATNAAVTMKLRSATISPSNSTNATSSACVIDPDKELWIRDLSVVEDPVRTVYVPFNPLNPSEGVWTFGRFIENMCGPNTPTDFVLHLFKQFNTTMVVNGFTEAPRPGFYNTVIQPWIDASGKKLNFKIAPFRLNGFVNRLDLRSNPTYGGGGFSAGEGRVVFTILTPDGFATIGTLILEYELVAENCEQVKAWANAWHELGSMDFGPAYNERLEKIVEGFAGAGAAPHKPNGSALNQLRTNELVGEFPWQWREFHLEKTTMLEMATVAQTPEITLNHTKALRDFINFNEADILADNYVVPLSWQGNPFRGGVSDGEPYDAFYEAPGILNNDARHIFSLNTCVACHSVETGTGFFHSSPRSAGQVTFLSGFLTGITVSDPVSGVPRSFNDLKRRAISMCKVLEAGCDELSVEEIVKPTH